MRAAVSREAGSVGIEQLDDPEPSTGEVLVEIQATGLCHTDLSVLEGNLPSPRPIVLGHEGAGVVAGVGPGVEGVRIGDRVVCTIITSCMSCFYCVRGEHALCERSVSFAGTMLDGTTRHRRGDEPIYSMLLQGTLSEAAVVPASAVAPIPPDVPMDVVAGLGCGVSTGLGAAMVRAPVPAGSSVLVVGAGVVGLATMMGAAAQSAGLVIAVDRDPSKLERAKALGLADVALLSDEGTLDQIRALTDGRGADRSFDAVGAPGTLELAVHGTRPGGTTVAIGVMDAGVTATFELFPFLMQRHLTGTKAGSILPRRHIPLFIDLFRAGKLPIDRLVDAHFALDDIGLAFDTLRSGGMTKGVVHP